MDTASKYLLVRADFVLGECQGADVRLFRRWRRILAGALPRLLGCAERSPTAEKVRLRRSEGGQGRYSGWVRIPVLRRPSRRRLRKLRARLRGRLEEGLLPVGGRVIKVGVRRVRRTALPAAVLPMPAVPAETAQSA